MEIQQPPNDSGLSDFERPIQHKFFVLLVPGGGSNPYDLAIGGILSFPKKTACY
jgi:hypothetical protein